MVWNSFGNKHDLTIPIKVQCKSFLSQVDRKKKCKLNFLKVFRRINLSEFSERSSFKAKNDCSCSTFISTYTQQAFYFNLCRTVSYRPDRIALGPITKTRLYNFDPLKPHFYIVKLGFTRVYIIFLISDKKRLWVLVRTASPRRF